MFISKEDVKVSKSPLCTNTKATKYIVGIRKQTATASIQEDKTRYGSK